MDGRRFGERRRQARKFKTTDSRMICDAKNREHGHALDSHRNLKNLVGTTGNLFKTAKGRGLSQYPRPHQKEENHFALMWAPIPTTLLLYYILVPDT